MKKEKQKIVNIMLILFLIGTLAIAMMSCDTTKPKNTEPNPVPLIFNVENAELWFETLETIKNIGDGHSYIINLLNDIEIQGDETQNTFGDVQNIEITIEGNNKSITLTSEGNLIAINSYQKITLNNLRLIGLGNVSTPLNLNSFTFERSFAG